MDLDIEQIKQFHGHMCPDLAVGIRAVQKVILEMGERPGDEQLVAVVETNNCAEDAIQFVTGCTFGKGNLLHLDYGKNAFRFFRLKDGKAIRIVIKTNFGRQISQDEEDMLKWVHSGYPTDENQQKQNGFNNFALIPFYPPHLRS